MKMTKETFLRKKAANRQELELYFAQTDNKKPGSLVRWRGSNEKVRPLINQEARLIVVWSVIPYDVPFLFFGDDKKPYQYLDESGVTDRAKRIADSGSVLAMIGELSRLHVAFVDAIDWCVSKAGSKKDRDIKRYTVDAETMESIKKQEVSEPKPTVIAATKVADWILESLGIKHEYLQFFNAKKQPWVELFKKRLGK